MLLENALSEEIESPRVAEVTQRDYTAEKDKTIAACSGAILTSLTSTYTLLGLLIGGRKQEDRSLEGSRIKSLAQRESSLRVGKVILGSYQEYVPGSEVIRECDRLELRDDGIEATSSRSIDYRY